MRPKICHAVYYKFQVLRREFRQKISKLFYKKLKQRKKTKKNPKDRKKISLKPQKVSDMHEIEIWMCSIHCPLAVTLLR